MNPGGDLLSHTVASAVPSARLSLTSVFGMGTGGTSALTPPEILYFSKDNLETIESKSNQYHKKQDQVHEPKYEIIQLKVLDLLVPVSSIPCGTYTSGLSTRSSSWSLTPRRGGISYLGASFTLRCFQRLSDPNIATRLCKWHHNRFTRGLSIPVLSY